MQLKITQACKERFKPVTKEVLRLLQETEHQEKEDVAARRGQECSERSGKPVFVGIDGMCATGKTTLGYYLKEQFDCNLFHMDDFFLPAYKRTPERLSEIGGNVDYERFREEVLLPVRRKEDVLYRPYDCQAGKISSQIRIPFRQLNIVEGSYSLHPYFGDIYALRVFTESAPERQLQNIRERNGDEMLERFREEWIPKENAYFERFRIREGCIVVPYCLT